jgi:hypothetical protein
MREELQGRGDQWKSEREEMKKPLRQQERLSLQGRIVPTDGRPIETFCGNTMVRRLGVSREFSDLNNFIFNNLRNVH